MGIVYHNLKDIPLPSFGYPDRNDGRAYIKITGDDGKVHRKTIGHLTDSTPGNERIVPNEYFKSIYQDLWAEAYPDVKLPAHELSIGMYALTLGVCEHNGLYKVLQDVYGTTYVNNVIDYAMYSIMYRSSTTQLFKQSMEKTVLFSDKLYSDSWYSTFFAEKITEDQHHLFRIKWVQHLVESGLKKVWLGIDGSNNDCSARQSYLARFGFPQSHNQNKTIVGYMYAVDADTGKPVTYFTYEGSIPDSPVFQKMATFLGGFDINIEGVILDRGFAVEEVFRKIDEEKWKYIVMLPTDSYGHKQMVQEHGEKIRWKTQYVLEDDALFGIADVKKLFGSHDRTSNICLFFDGTGGSSGSVRLLKKIQTAKKKAEKAIASGSRAAIEKKLKNYLSIEGEGCERKVIIHYEECDKCMASKGFFSLATSAGITPGQGNAIYKKRDTSETQFCILKSQEGGNTTRVHKTESIYGKFAITFIASIIRSEIETTCKKLDLDTNPMIQGMDRVTLLYTAEGQYEAVRNLTTEQKLLFAEYKIDQDTLEQLASDFNRRNKTDSYNPERALPVKPVPKARINSRKAGRPPGTSTESTDDSKKGPAIERSDISAKVKSKGGRPRGTKDTKPRKPRSDKGKKRGPRMKLENGS